ncbi:phosphoglucosamine mutase [Kamptonema cortianum]|nr:phosphoglucosamine mutase [Geitlerinema splendidum]MDK3158393.1 phosphoglucosamine mutase [Kamptonema cortianum]
MKFGTDGVRGVANVALTPELAFKIGQAAGRWLVVAGEQGKVLIGRDTRVSGSMLGAALASGFCSVGISVDSVGVFPTGGISYLARTQEYCLAAVISASHNPAPDNGIKLMTSSGTKIPTELERFIEDNLNVESTDRPVAEGVGHISTGVAGAERYLNWLCTLVPERLEGMTIAIDAANGAASHLGVEVFKMLGANVLPTACNPDGMNINAQCGATHPDTILELTRKHQADLGVAYDGDADRAVFSDSEGRLINGDRMMAVWCSHWMKHGTLNPPIVVGTVMSNGGFGAFMEKCGIQLIRTDVGDKYVSAKLSEINGKVGGEQSGHIIFPEHGPTGDGLVTALQLARVIRREGKSAADLYGDFENWPQLLVNVQVDRKEGWESDTDLQAAISDAQRELTDRGRVNVRASGTQPMLRVMVEADDSALRDAVCDRIVSKMLERLGGKIYSRVDLTHALGD